MERRAYYLFNAVGIGDDVVVVIGVVAIGVVTRAIGCHLALSV